MKAARRNIFAATNQRNQFAQPLAFAVRLDLSRNADMLHGRHVNQKPARQGDVRSDARALLGNWLFGDLDEYLLSLA